MHKDWREESWVTSVKDQVRAEGLRGCLPQKMFNTAGDGGGGGGSVGEGAGVYVYPFGFQMKGYFNHHLSSTELSIIWVEKIGPSL